MPDPELERLIGPGLEPTDDFLSSLRDRVTGEWHAGAVAAHCRRRPRVATAVGVAAALALVVGAVAWFGRDSKQTVAPASTTTTTTTVPDADDLQLVATIVFDEPTEAWASASEGKTDDYLEYVDMPGRHVLYQRDDAWFVGFFDDKDLVTETPVDKVPDGEEHWVTWSLQPQDNELLIVDGYAYRQDSGSWVQTGGPIPGLTAPGPSVDEERSSTQAWAVTYSGVNWIVPKPIGWDGRPPTLSALYGQTSHPYDVAMVAHTATASVFWSLSADGGVASGSLDGLWSLLNADEDRLELAVIDPARLDHSVVRVPWAALLD